MSKLIKLICLLGFLSIQGCDEEDLVQTPDHNGSVIVDITTAHLNDQYDIVTFNRVYWVKNQVVKHLITVDTVPSLGDTTIVIEDQNGADTTISYKKDYELYITIQ